MVYKKFGKKKSDTDTENYYSDDVRVKDERLPVEYLAFCIWPYSITWGSFVNKHHKAGSLCTRS